MDGPRETCPRMSFFVLRNESVRPRYFFFNVSLRRRVSDPLPFFYLQVLVLLPFSMQQSPPFRSLEFMPYYILPAATREEPKKGPEAGVPTKRQLLISV